MGAIDEPVLNLLLQQGHVPAGAFAATCQKALKLVEGHIDHWDCTRMQFLGCDVVPKDPNARVGLNVIISPFRVRDSECRGENYPRDLKSVQKLTQACYNFSDNLRVVHFHRVPFLDVSLPKLSLIIEC
jgi:hypothetical protein